MSVAQLRLGQRVFVLRDEVDERVGAWGNVIRECSDRRRAWVRLDERHPRCSFPADIGDDRARWILTSPDCCTSVPPEDL